MPPTPNLGFWILLDHFKPFSFLLSILLKSTAVELFCTNSPFQFYPTVTVTNWHGFSRRCIGSASGCSTNCQEKATSFPTNQNHMGFHHWNHQAEGVILQQLTICQGLVLTTTLHLFHHHLFCQLSQAGIMRCNPPRLLANLWLQFV